MVARIPATSAWANRARRLKTPRSAIYTPRTAIQFSEPRKICLRRSIFAWRARQLACKHTTSQSLPGGVCCELVARNMYMTRAVISVSLLKKHYGTLAAVDGVSLEVFEGEIFGLIGPNGAGKTTTMECIEGLRKPDAGTVRVLGMDPQRDAASLRQRIGVQHQEAHLQKRIKVWEAIDLWSSLYRQAVDADDLLLRLGLENKRNAWFMALSGGQKQRLFVALALIHDPEVVFLDELTTGLDPQARRAIWELILGIKERGKTVFLTTHLMEEAERLCDRVGIIEHGRLIEIGRPAELVARHCPEQRVVFSSDNTDVVERLTDVESIRSVTSDGMTHTLHGTGTDFVTDVIHVIARKNIHVQGFRTELPTLEDVFLKLTGHGIRD